MKTQTEKNTTGRERVTMGRTMEDGKMVNWEDGNPTRQEYLALCDVECTAGARHIAAQDALRCATREEWPTARDAVCNTLGPLRAAVRAVERFAEQHAEALAL